MTGKEGKNRSTFKGPTAGGPAEGSTVFLEA